MDLFGVCCHLSHRGAFRVQKKANREQMCSTIANSHARTGFFYNAQVNVKVFYPVHGNKKPHCKQQHMHANGPCKHLPW